MYITTEAVCYITLYCMAQSNMRHRLAKHSHVIDKHFSMLPSPELRRRNIDRYHTFFHANKWQTELAILSLQTCMLTVLAAQWLFYCAHSTMDTRCTAAHSTMDTHCTAHNLKEIPAEKNTEFCQFLRAMPKPGKAMGSHTI